MARQNITMPKLGESVTEGTIEKWLVQVGDVVEKYAPLAEVNTDKVNAEIPSSFSGTIKALLAKEGETLAVGEVVCILETADGGNDEGDTQGLPIVEEAPQPQEKRSDEASHKKLASGRFSPAVMRLAQENHIDLAVVEGTGRDGRITRKDIQELLDSGERHTAPIANSSKVISNTVTTTVQSANQGDIEIPITSVRRTIANNMVRAKQEVPHAWMMVEVDVTNLATYRDAVKNSFKQEEGFNLTYFAFFVKAIAQALKEFPMMNSTWAGDAIVQKKDINISIAVAAEELLYVPVIRHADEKTIKAIARDIHELALKARTGKLTADDMQGGTFTVNNTGSFGSIQSMGIINHPQAAIVQVESIVKRPVIMADNMIGIRHMVNLCLSLDHRVLDGLLCGRFLARVKEILEHTTAENTPLY